MVDQPRSTGINPFRVRRREYRLGINQTWGNVPRRCVVLLSPSPHSPEHVNDDSSERAASFGIAPRQQKNLMRPCC